MRALLAFLPGGPVLAGIWSFLTSTIGLVLIASVAAYITGYQVADRKADVEKLQSQVATMKADQNTSESARVLAEKQSEGLEAQLTTNQAKVDALIVDLEKRAKEAERLRKIAASKPGSAACPTAPRDCGISAADVRRLKEIQ